MDKLPPVFHALSSFDAARGEVTTLEGAVIPMLRLILKVERQDAAGQHPPEQLPDVWVEAHTAAALSVAIQTALWRHLPEEAERMGLPRPQGAAPGASIS